MRSDSKVNVCLISYHYEEERGRPNLVKRALSAMDFVKDLRVVASNFDHITKEVIPNTEQNITRLRVRQYSNNISLKRVLSYWDFARQLSALPILTTTQIAYVCVPDYLSALTVLRRRTGRTERVIIDVVDLWPEALPLPRLVNGLLKWALGSGIKRLRQRLFRDANLVLFQSQYFLSQFGGNGERYGFLPMCAGKTSQADFVWDGPSLASEIRILFLGSMNSITDLASLVHILRILVEERKVSLSVVGGGSSLGWLKEQLRGTPVITTFYGITFDKDIKNGEFRQTHFGYNGYRETTEVAVSYKSLELLQHGIPLINSAKGDTFEIVRNEECGLNFERKSLQAVAKRILSLTDVAHSHMRQNARRAFEVNFSYPGFCRALATYMEKLLVDFPPDRLGYRRFRGAMILG